MELCNLKPKQGYAHESPAAPALLQLELMQRGCRRTSSGNGARTPSIPAMPASTYNLQRRQKRMVWKASIRVWGAAVALTVLASSTGLSDTEKTWLAMTTLPL